jgi:hypothetical protein
MLFAHAVITQQLTTAQCLCNAPSWLRHSDSKKHRFTLFSQPATLAETGFLPGFSAVFGNMAQRLLCHVHEQATARTIRSWITRQCRRQQSHSRVPATAVFFCVSQTAGRVRNGTDDDAAKLE